ncbi:MAG: hypothetical protein FWD31_11905 [Planctomycetaceae bacterium]|nr:hypothetical protein [Planctomycetaceae bacterium]
MMAKKTSSRKQNDTILPMCDFPLNRAFTFFEPGPVLLVVTSINGRHNVMTASWTMSLGFRLSPENIKQVFVVQ